MKNIITQSPRIILLTEFWPFGLFSAGSDPYALLQTFENLGLKIFQIKGSNSFKAVVDKKKLIGKLRGRKYTNLVLLGRDAELKT